MASILRLIRMASYWLGLVSVLLALAIRTIPPLAGVVPVKPASLLTFAATLFLCALASRFVSEIQAS